MGTDCGSFQNHEVRKAVVVGTGRTAGKEGSNVGGQGLLSWKHFCMA